MTIYIHPGEYHFSTGSDVIQTVLGSCLTIIMRCQRLGFAAFSHAQLPTSSCKDGTVPCLFRYVDTAIIAMYEKFAGLNITKDEIEVKIVGGGDVLDFVNKEKATIGRQNIEAAIKTLEELNLKIAGMDVGGSYGRKVSYSTDTGLVHVKQIKKNIMLAENYHKRTQ